MVGGSVSAEFVPKISRGSSNHGCRRPLLALFAEAAFLDDGRAEGGHPCLCLRRSHSYGDCFRLSSDASVVASELVMSQRFRSAFHRHFALSF